MRPPFGSYSDTVLQVAAAHNQSVINWDFEYVRLSCRHEFVLMLLVLGIPLEHLLRRVIHNMML